MYLYPNAELWIYNRWGELVYYTDDVAGEPWDGTFNGRDLPIDSYHYVLDLGNDEPPRRGNVTIVR
jgi:gliding motility-associated-like protein